MNSCAALVAQTYQSAVSQCFQPAARRCFRDVSPESGARNAWLRNAWRWVREHDPAGYVQMPGLRIISGAANGQRWHDVNQPSAATPNGFDQDETVRAICASDRQGTREN